jgi:pimeloyl-ACP methyl ester carboxylesterase
MSERPRLPTLLRTIGRFQRPATWASQALSWLTPSVLERAAAERFAEPRRPHVPIAPYVQGVPEHRFRIPFGDDELAAWDWGEGPTVLLVHGWNGQASQMAGFVQPLVSAGYHVVAFDLPGHGVSAGGRATLHDLAEAVRTVADRVQSVHAIVAHSLGATATVVAMSRGLHVERAVLLAPPADVPPFARAFGAALGLPPTRVDGMLGAIETMLGGDLGAYDLRRLVPDLHVPLLVLHDGEDRSVPFAHGKQVAQAAWSARLVRLAGLGHVGGLVDRAVIRTAVDFIGATATASAAPARRTA